MAKPPSRQRITKGISRVRAWLMAAIVTCSSFVPVYGVEYSAVEGELRAAVTVGVLRFTSWTGNEAVNDTTLKVCLVGSPISEPFLLPVNGTAQVGAKHLLVAKLGESGWEQCQAFVIGAKAKEATYSHLLEFAQSHHALTICDGCSAELAESTMITLLLEKQRVRFEVSLQRAHAAEIRLDASLLELASLVRK